ncbi:MAG: alpha/beta hydrolase [Polyangiales bacterium]
MQQEILLYNHAEMVPVTVDQHPVSLCVSRVPPQDTTRSPRGRMLLLHGNPANMHDFGALAALLRDDFEVVALDLPGFGRSENVRCISAETVLHTYARHVVAAIDRIGWDGDFYLLGHSHGGGVAQTIAALYPERIKGLILLGSIGTPAHWGYQRLTWPGVALGLRLLSRALRLRSPREVRWRIVQAIMRPIFAPHPLARTWIDAQLAVVDRRPEILVNMALVAAGDPCGELARIAPKIRAPTLFVHGDTDWLVPASHPRTLYETIARSVQAEFHELLDTGHMLHISHPDRIQALILDWVRRLSSADSRSN